MSVDTQIRPEPAAAPSSSATRATGLRAPNDVARLRVTGPRVLHSEWVKFRSLRSTVVTIAVAVVVFFQHRANIGRLMRGQEPRVGKR